MPSTVGMEKACNPFMRVREPGVSAGAGLAYVRPAARPLTTLALGVAHGAHRRAGSDPVDVMQEVRKKKDQWRPSGKF